MTNPGIGHNSANTVVAPINETQMGHLLHRLKAQFRAAEETKKDAARVMRESRAKAKSADAEFFDQLERVRATAIERVKGRYRADATYQEAERRSEEAKQDMRDIVKGAKAAGVDVQAFKQALKLAEMDVEERTSRFDNIDIYAKALGLWGKTY